MKKFIDLMLAAIMICGASVFTSCNTDAIDNPALPSPTSMYPNRLRAAGLLLKWTECPCLPTRRW